MYSLLARQRLRKLMLFAFIGCLVNATVFADSEIKIPTRQEARLVNDDTIGVVFTHEELFHQLVHNMESALEQESDLRIVPIMGKNHVQSIYDLLYLKGVDLALVRADAIEYVRTEGNYPTIKRLIKNIAKVSEEKIVIIARKDYDTVDDLQGQVVSFGVQGSGEHVTSTIAFRALGIEPEYLEVDNRTAIEKMKTGELAAMVYLLREPDAVQTGEDLEAANAVKNMQLGEDLHLLELPESDAMSIIYTPSTLTQDDLPGLINEGDSISTYSVNAILAAYGWAPGHPRYKQSVRFVTAFVDGLEDLTSGVYQPTWKRVELGQPTPNVEQSAILDEVLEERVARKARLAELSRIAREKAEADAKAEKVSELKTKRDEITARLGKELSDADTVELERMLEELNSFLERRD